MNNTKPLMTLHADGRITVREDADVSETARLVLELMEEQLRNMIKAAYRRAIEDAVKVCDDRYSDCREPEAKEIAESIRKLLEQ